MLQTIGDPYTRFLTPNEYDTLAGLARGSTAMSSAGIGVEIVYLSDLARGPAAGSAGDRPAIASVVPGGPAEGAGVRANDAIVAVDGEATAGLGLDAVAARLRGPPGTDVRVTLERAGRPVDVTVRRAEIKFQGLTDEMGTLRGRPVGVITIKTFSKETARDLAAAVRRLQDAGATAFVVDLRHNPGGFFPGGIDAARVFLPAGRTIVSVVDRNGIGDTFATPDNAAPLTDRPVVLVVDDRTASASEVFSAALKENGRAALVGHRTFGKARVQTLNQLFDGSGVAVTISLYSTPQGNDINKVGIAVDKEADCPYPGPALDCIPESVQL